jgi:hypothetical protein
MLNFDHCLTRSNALYVCVFVMQTDAEQVVPALVCQLARQVSFGEFGIAIPLSPDHSVCRVSMRRII